MDSPIARMDFEASKMGEQMMSHLLKAVTDTCPPADTAGKANIETWKKW